MRILLSVLMCLGWMTSNTFGQLRIPENSNNQNTSDPINYYADFKKAMIGKELPNVIFTDSSNRQFDLRSLKGKMVAINVWAFGCKPCIAEMPDLNKLVKKYDKSVIFISLILGNKAISHSQLKNVYNVDFDYNTCSTDEDIFRLWNLIMAFPTHLIIGKDGKLLDLYLGPRIEGIDYTIKMNMNI
jgi:thiol-disulfide isomerase/thioredoxin